MYMTEDSSFCDIDIEFVIKYDGLGVQQKKKLLQFLYSVKKRKAINLVFPNKGLI